MKLRFITILFFLITITIVAQEKITKQQWQNDLRSLQKKVHNDFPFLFKKVTAKEFDEAVNQLHKEIPNLQEHEIIVGFSKVVALFKYGHSFVSFRQEPFKFSQFPFSLYEFNDGIYIQGTHKNYPKAVGAKVISIEGKPIKEALEIIRPTVEEENSQYFKAYGINNLTYPEILHSQRITEALQSSVTLTLEKNGTTFQQTFNVLPNKARVPKKYTYVQQNGDWLSARNQEEIPLYFKNLDKNYYYEYLPKQKTVYVRYSSVFDDKVETTEAFYKRVFEFIDTNDVEKLILDVRLNGGGNSYLVRPIITGIIEAKKINQKGKLFVITGRNTFSACQNFVNRLHNYTNAIFVGEPTSENINFYGDATNVTLPNSKLSVRLSFAWWQEKGPWENEKWLSPELSVDTSFEEYKTNQDPVLDAIFNFNSDTFISRPMEHIRKLFMQGKIETMQRDIASMMQDPRYKYFDFESKFINSGKLLLKQAQYQHAIGALSLVAQTYPNSAEAWKLLGDCYSKIGDSVKAKEFYRKALAIDSGIKIEK